MTYKDFDLLVERAPKGFRAQVLSSPAGQAAADFELPFSQVELENCLLRLGRPARRVRRLESTEMQTAKTFGAALFNAVFSGDVRACLRSSMDEAKRENTGIRIRIHLADPELADLPWEFLYNPAVNRFLALSVQTPLVRYMDLPEIIQPVSVSQPIRILVMISSPADYPALDVEAEWKRLNDALADLVGSGVIAIERLDEATLGALQRRLRRAQYHIFHFIGHGEFDQTLQEGVLLLERENQRGHRVGSQYLGMLLHDHDSLRVAILNACEGARSSRQDPFAGSAQTLVQQGIPAVIAMQFEIADDVASTFAHEFYGALSDGYPIDAAVTEARKAIFAAGRETEWATPVLYLRAPDGRIFDVAGRAAATAAVVSAPYEASPVETSPRAEPPVREDRLTTLLRTAGIALAQGKYIEAFDHLHEARAINPDAPNLATLTATAEEQRAVAETRAYRRAEFHDQLAAAAAHFARNDFSAALEHVTDALGLRPDDNEARALEARIRRAMDVPGQVRTEASGHPETLVARAAPAPDRPDVEPRERWGKGEMDDQALPHDEQDLIDD